MIETVRIAAGEAGRLPAFLQRGGDTGGLIARFDWSQTSLGSLRSWPQALKTTLGIVLGANVPMCLLWGRDGVMIYNDGYAALAGGRHPSMLGSRVTESWPEIASFNANVLEVGFSGGSLAYHDRHLVLLRNGIAEDCWFDLNYTPVPGEAGEVVGVLAIASETTRRLLAEQEVARNQQRLTHALNASGVIGVWDWHVESDLMFSDARYASFFAVDPQRARNGVPRPEFVAAIHSDDRERLDAEIGRTIETGADLSLEHRIVQTDGSIRWVMVRGSSFCDPQGKPTRLSGAAVDITERKELDESRRLLVRELHHRVKNTFAVIGGMVTMTARSAPSVEDMASVLRGRIVALASAHELIRPAITAEFDHSEHTTLDDLFGAILAPHLFRAEQFTLDAPEVEIGVAAATSLGLVLHELATNASKYGALSSAKGALRVEGTIDEDRLRIEWTETGGPQVTGPPEHQGFGSRLAGMSVAGQLAGALEFHWQPEGLRVVLTAARERLER